MEDKPRPYICKLFKDNEWHVLGTVYAHDDKEAWDKAHKQWASVTTVFDLFASD